jgi:uncharacterized membrane protein (UPF0182 family)
MNGRRWALIALLVAAVALLAGRALAQLYTDYLWYASIGAADVWRARITSLSLLRVTCAAVATLFVFANLYAVRQSVVSLVLPRRVGNIEFGEEVPKPQLTWMAFALSAVIGLGFAWSRGDWSQALASRIGQPFGEADPYFAVDLGFFVYRLPLELSLFTWMMTMVLLVIGLVVLLYALTPSLRWEQGGLYVSGYVRRHLAMLAGVLLLVLAWHYRLEMYAMLGRGSGLEGAFTSVDHRVGIPASLLMSIVTLGAGLTVLWAGWTGQLRLAFAALTGVIVAALAARQLAPFLAKRSAATDVAARERPYEATRAGYTRRAFGVDRVTMADSSAVFASLAEASPYVPIWDEAVLGQTPDRPVEASLGWTASDSGLHAVVPSLASSLATVSYIASASDESGTPVRLVQQGEPPRGAPRMLFVADSSPRSLVIPDSTGRIAAPSLGSGASRLAHALSKQDFSLWLGTLPSPSPKLVSRRGVRERVDAVAPYFAQGSTITPIWYGDSLVWAVELYSNATHYPLSRRVTINGSQHSYFQHAATALVNATTGRLLLVADSLADPMASTWMTRFPRLFARAGALPANLRRQLPPDRDGSRAQAVAFGRYGMRGETDVARHLPDDEGPDSALAGTAPPLVGFPKLGATGYVLPLLDRSERLRGLFIALGGPAHRSLWLPAKEPAPLWNEVLDRLRAADTVSASLLVRGYVRSVPLPNEIVLVQPRYDWRGGTPRLMYVAAMVGDTVRAARTLSQLAGYQPDSTRGGTSAQRARALQLYEEMRRASQRGDWAAYGRAFEQLGRVLKERRPDG